MSRTASTLLEERPLVAPSDEPPHRRTRRGARMGRNRGYAFLAPTLLALAAFTLYPLVETIRLSFTNSNGIRGQFIGLENYQYVLADGEFWAALVNTLYIGVLALVIGVPLSLVVATLINTLGRTSGIYKALYFSPNITSAIAAALAFSYLFYPAPQGWMNTFLGYFGVEPLRWFADPEWARFGVVLMSVWHGLGYTTLIWLAALQSIPAELHEAASVDGAHALRRWWHVTVPGLRSITFFIVVVQSIGMFKRFADVYQIGGSDGQPGGTLTTLMVYIYRVGFNNFDFGKASAAALVMFAMIIVLTLVNFAFFRKGTEQ